ncbi:MAG: hypothetical protein ACK2UM_01155 [Anaerolineales bacterium]
MREIKPYKTFRGAHQALDNGGRFYNLFTRSGDDIVEPSELARAAGVFSSDARALLFFEMGISGLSSVEKEQVIGQLSPELREMYLAQKPNVLSPSVVESQGKAGEATIVTGYPVFVEDRTRFTGFIVLVVPVIVMVPIFDQFDVYEVFDTPDLNESRSVIATTRGTKRMDGIYTRFGGMLKELYFEDKTSKDHGLYLETLFYTNLEG